MRRFVADCRSLWRKFGAKALFDAKIGAIIFSALVMIPVYIILIQILIVFMYKVNTMTILLIVATLFYNVLFFHLFKQALKAKQPEAATLVNSVLNSLMIAITVFLLVAGLVILFVMVPIWLV